MKINKVTDIIIGSAINVHKELGPGLLESAYEICLAHELKEQGLFVEKQKPIPIIYKDIKLDCGYRADLVVEKLVVVELKSKESLHPIDHMQLLSHLRILKLEVGLLINFNVTKLKEGIKRIVNNYKEF